MIDDTQGQPEDTDGADGHGLVKPNAFERITTTTLSLAMILLPVAGIVLRLVRGHAIDGGSVYVQHLTVWLGFFGAYIATGGGSHLGLSTAMLLPKGRWRNLARITSWSMAAVTTLILTFGAYVTVRNNSVSNAKLTGGIPEWWADSAVPLALAMICARFIWRTPAVRSKDGEPGWSGRIISLAACGLVVLLFLTVGAKKPEALVWPGTIVILVAFLLGAPLFVGMSALAMLFFFVDGAIATVPTEMMNLARNPTMPALPLLTLAGYVLASGKAWERLLRLYKALLGWVPGGLSLMVLLICALFTALTGGSGVTILALGGLLLPPLLQEKFPEGFSIGLLTAAGSLGLLFPPSIPVLLYGIVAGVTDRKLYQAGFLPSVLLLVVAAIYAVRAGLIAKAPRHSFDTRELLRAAWAAKWDLGLPVIVVAVLFSGYATIVEAAAVGALYSILIESTVYKDIHPRRDMPRVIARSSSLIGAVLIVLGAAFGLTSLMVDREIPQLLVEWATKHIHAQWVFLLALNGALLVLGSLFEIYAAIIVLAPLVAPLGAEFKVDPVHLGVVFLANLELGFLFPPMGLNLFLSASRFHKPLPYLYRQALPFLIILTIGVLVITYVPAMTTGVVALFNK
jgi:tripartite ATP-independent transporter DctM subunit